jgi:hypothetical protein
MGMWTAIALIVIACVIGDALRRRWESRSGTEFSERLDAMETKIDALDDDLRERVQNLERIVTDRQADLKREFDHLDKAS